MSRYVPKLRKSINLPRQIWEWLDHMIDEKRVFASYSHALTYITCYYLKRHKRQDVVREISRRIRGTVHDAAKRKKAIK